MAVTLMGCMRTEDGAQLLDSFGVATHLILEQVEVTKLEVLAAEGAGDGASALVADGIILQLELLELGQVCAGEEGLRAAVADAVALKEAQGDLEGWLSVTLMAVTFMAVQALKEAQGDDQLQGDSE